MKIPKLLLIWVFSSFITLSNFSYADTGLIWAYSNGTPSTLRCNSQTIVNVVSGSGSTTTNFYSGTTTILRCPSETTKNYVAKGKTSPSNNTAYHLIVGCSSDQEFYNNQCVLKCVSPEVRNASGVCETPPNYCNLDTHEMVGNPAVCTPKCVLPQVRNSSGVCETPIVCEAGKKSIIPVIVRINCTNDDCTNGDNTKVSPLNTLCHEGCVFDKIPYHEGGTVHECYRIDFTVPYNGLCDLDYKKTGQSCSFIEAPSTNPRTPLESTSVINDELNSSGTSTSNPNNDGSNTNANNSGAGANPSASGTSTGANQPNESAQINNNTGGAPCTSGGGDCASEDTLKDIRDAVTNSNGTNAPNITGNEITSENLKYELTKDSKLQNLLRFEIPAHNGQCPTLDLSIPYLNVNLVFNSHCTIAAPQFDNIRALSIASWIFLAVMVILGA